VLVLTRSAVQHDRAERGQVRAQARAARFSASLWVIYHNLFLCRELRMMMAQLDSAAFEGCVPSKTGLARMGDDAVLASTWTGFAWAMWTKTISAGMTDDGTY